MEWQWMETYTGKGISWNGTLYRRLSDFWKKDIIHSYRKEHLFSMTGLDTQKNDLGRL